MPQAEKSGGNYMIRVTYEVTQDVLLNQSAVRVTGVEIKPIAAINTMNVYLLGEILVDGQQGATLNLGNTYGCGATISNSDYAGGGVDSGWGGWGVGFRTQEVTVAHAQDGSASCILLPTIHLYYRQNRIDTTQAKIQVQLPRIPRTSALEVQEAELGQPMKLKLTRVAAEFVDTVAWRCGSASGVIAEKCAESVLSWTPPLELAAQAPDSDRAEITLTVSTFLGDTQSGSEDTRVYCPVPDSVVPTLEVTVEDRMGYADGFGGYIQGQSQVRVRTQAQSPYAGSIRRITVSCGRLTDTGADVSFALENAGQVPVSVSVEDSRGRMAMKSIPVQVLPYRSPQVSIREALRCDQEGTPQSDGTWLKVVFDAEVSALTGNGVQYRGSCALHDGTDSRQVLLEAYTDQFTVTGGSFLLPAGLDSGYDCRVIVQDHFCTVLSGTALVSVAFALMDFYSGTRAVGIGMRAVNPGMLSVGLDTDMSEHRLGNLAAPELDADAATKAYVDGCIRQLAQQLGLE